MHLLPAYAYRALPRPESEGSTEMRWASSRLSALPYTAESSNAHSSPMVKAAARPHAGSTRFHRGHPDRLRPRPRVQRGPAPLPGRHAQMTAQLSRRADRASGKALGCV